MIPEISPAVKKLDATFKLSEIVLINDHMPYPDDIMISVDGVPCYSKNTIIDLFKSNGISHTDKIFCSDHYVLFEDLSKFLVNINKNFFLKFAKQFVESDASSTIPIGEDIQYNFCFMSNKARYHRTLCSTVIANLFNETQIAYTYNAGINDSMVADELLLGTNYGLDVSKQLPESVYLLPGDVKDEWGGIRVTRTPAMMYPRLFDRLYKNVAVAIVTEPCFFEHGNIITEKTLMSIYAGLFMIWPGAWKLPETVKKLGIDVFDDVIDHSYQYIEHPGKRVVEAFLLNKEFLMNIDAQKLARQQYLHRLQNNLDIVRNITDQSMRSLGT